MSLADCTGKFAKTYHHQDVAHDMCKYRTFGDHSAMTLLRK